jgi:hypothetical protein
MECQRLYVRAKRNNARHRDATFLPLIRNTLAGPDDGKNGRVTRQIKNDFRVKARKISNLQGRERTFTIVRKQSKKQAADSRKSRGKHAAKISQLETTK